MLQLTRTVFRLWTTPSCALEPLRINNIAAQIFVWRGTITFDGKSVVVERDSSTGCICAALEGCNTLPLHCSTRIAEIEVLDSEK